MAAAKIDIETIRIPSSHIILISDIHFGRYNSGDTVLLLSGSEGGGTYHSGITDAVGIEGGA